MRSENDQPNSETKQLQTRRAGSTDASSLRWVGGEVSKEVIMKRLHALLAATSLVASTTAAAAPVPQSITVDVGTLDLGSDKGQRILAMRIQRAARAMCESQAVKSLPRYIRHERECIRQAQASAEAAIKTLTATAASTAGKGG